MATGGVFRRSDSPKLAKKLLHTNPSELKFAAFFEDDAQVGPGHLMGPWGAQNREQCG